MKQQQQKLDVISYYIHVCSCVSGARDCLDINEAFKCVLQHSWNLRKVPGHDWFILFHVDYFTSKARLWCSRTKYVGINHVQEARITNMCLWLVRTTAIMLVIQKWAFQEIHVQVYTYITIMLIATSIFQCERYAQTDFWEMIFKCVVRPKLVERAQSLNDVTACLQQDMCLQATETFSWCVDEDLDTYLILNWIEVQGA